MITPTDRLTLRALMDERDATLADIIRSATNGPIDEKDAAMLCLVCGLSVDDVLPPQQPVRNVWINDKYDAEWRTA